MIGGLSALPRTLLRNAMMSGRNFAFSSISSAEAAQQKNAEPIENHDTIDYVVDKSFNSNSDDKSFGSNVDDKSLMSNVHRESNIDESKGVKRGRTQTFNIIHLMGRVGTDPVVRGNDFNNIICFSLATNRRVRTSQDSTTFHDIADWHNIIVSGERAKRFASSFVKRGDLIYVTGSLSYRKFSPNGVQDDRSVSIPQIKVDDIRIVQHKAAFPADTEVPEPEK